MSLEREKGKITYTTRQRKRTVRIFLQTKKISVNTPKEYNFKRDPLMYSYVNRT